ncbi:hypothetical protein H8S95_15400 [Pontibacter sp. KCTC 32443]|uniref:hypothetical protein n=1 Tax=Pontibacter TaxID=323449 RepID=UPI00164E9907|nr:MULTISPECIES: hypothetical protein [Pontibacter]MBC5775463.1 hypothetical protein [Pontibacter sp. KCTC 32443]
MKTNKPLKEAILRAPESTEENNQSQQEQLYHMGDISRPGGEANKPHTPQDLVDERARNCMESLHNLRELEYDVEKIKKSKL